MGSGSPAAHIETVGGFRSQGPCPLGALLLDEPPEESVPIPDYRTVGGGQIPQPSPNLLDTIYLCQERQAWYQDYLRSMGAEPLGFVGSLTITSDPRAAAEAIRDELRTAVDERLKHGTPREAMSACIASAERAGVLVMVSGIVGSNTRRKLDPGELRGFALADPVAPLVFVHGMDAESAQMFTLAHGLAHLWLGASALWSLPSPSAPGIKKEEAWCNAVAAEFLAPLADTERVGRSDGGSLRRTAVVRVSRPFVRAVIANTLEGRTRFPDAFRMLGVRNPAALDRMAGDLGLTP